jgi:thiamine-phosphate pyrophosphorylase
VLRVVVVTDRKLLGGAAIAGRIEAMLATAPRGSVAIQVREKDLDGGPLLRLVREVIDVARPAGAQVWVNDRADVALAAGADGVHLPEAGLTIAEARAAVGDAMAIGCSRHTAHAVLAAEEQGAALVQLGPVWSVPGKGDAIGLDGLAIRLRVPLVAVGGIDGPARARHAAIAGADAVAVIRAAWQGNPDVVGKLVEAVEVGVAARKTRLQT